MGEVMKLVKKKSLDFNRSVTDKNLIVLHYTAGGTLAGAEATLSIADYVNVHYCIDKDGTVYQYYPEKNWAYHRKLLCQPLIWLEQQSKVKICPKH